MTKSTRKADAATVITAGINFADDPAYAAKVEAIRKELTAASGFKRAPKAIDDHAREAARAIAYERYGLDVYSQCADFITQYDKNGPYTRRNGWRADMLLGILREDFGLCLIDMEPAILHDPITMAMCDGYYSKGKEALRSVIGRVLQAGVHAYNKNTDHPHTAVSQKDINDLVGYVYDRAGDRIMEGRTYDKQLGVFVTADGVTIRVTEHKGENGSSGTISHEPVTPDDHVLYAGRLPVSYNLPDQTRLAEARAFIDDWLLSLADGDEARRDRIVELGLSAPMMPSTKIPGAAVFFGHGNEGKSTLVGISQAMFGSSHTFTGSNFTEIFGSRFGLSPAACGAHFVRIDEMSSHTLDPDALAKVKTVSSGQGTTTDVKGGITNAPVPLLYAIMTTNHAIKFPTGDASVRTLERRFHLAYFPNSLPDDKVDKAFASDFIHDEYKMCALLHIAIEGVERMLAQGDVTKVEQDDAMMRRWITGSDSVGTWLEECDLFGRDLEGSHFNLISRRGSRDYTCVAPASWFTGKVYLTYGEWTSLPEFDMLMNSRRDSAEFYLASESRLVSANDIHGHVIQHGFSNETTIAYERYLIWRDAEGHRRNIAKATFMSEMEKHGYVTKRMYSPVGQRTFFVPESANITNAKEYSSFLNSLSDAHAEPTTDTDKTDKSTDFRTWLSENKTARALLDYRKGNGTAFASDDAAHAAAFDLFCALCDRFDLGM